MPRAYEDLGLLFLLAQAEGVGLAPSELDEGHQGDSSTSISKGGTAKQQQRLQTKPGKSDAERVLGSLEERIHKRLKTAEASQDESSGEPQAEESELYEHIKDPKSQHDAQTLDAATEEQQREQPVPNLKETKTEELTEEDEDMKADDRETAMVSFGYLNDI